MQNKGMELDSRRNFEPDGSRHGKTIGVLGSWSTNIWEVASRKTLEGAQIIISWFCHSGKHTSKHCEITQRT